MELTGDIKVFLVDDDQLFLDALQHYLSQHYVALEIKTFSTGEECLKNIGEQPKIVILDYYLNSSVQKAMNGMEVLKKIAHQSPDTQVIMLSGQEKLEIAVESIKHGAADYVVKGESAFVRIVSIINRVIHYSSQKQELKYYRLIVRTLVAFILLLFVFTIALYVFKPHLFE